MRFNSTYLRIILLTLILLVGGQDNLVGAMAQQRSFWGMIVSDAAGTGVKITALRDKSPAGNCLKLDDVLLAIESTAIKSVQQFELIKDNFPLYTPVQLTIKRNNVIMQTQITLEGRKMLEVKALTNSLKIPGVEATTKKIPHGIELLDTINVLDQVLINPTTGQMEIIGHYDARYLTGGIPYLDLLKTALQYPKPKLNLHPSKEAKALLAAEENKLQDWNVRDFILGHPKLELERQLLLQAWASACKLTVQELVSLYNYNYFATKKVQAPREIINTQRKLFTNLGYIEVAEAYALLNQTEPDAVAALQKLGKGLDVKLILAKNKGDAKQAQGIMIATAYLAIMEQIYAPAGVANSLREELAQGKITWQEVVIAAQGYFIPFRNSTSRKEIVYEAFNKIQLSETGTQTLSKIPLKGAVYIEPIDVDASSQLNKILYKADYSLKSLKAMPDLFWHIPGSTSEQEYLIEQKKLNLGQVDILKAGITTEFWLEPKTVVMEVSSGRDLVSFGKAEMSYKSNTYFSNPKVAQTKENISQRYALWCERVMNNYDAYAEVLPAFHEVRELAKIIALANWLIENKVVVNLEKVEQEKWQIPQSVAGYWRASFLYYDENNDGNYSLYNTDGSSYSGGVTFKNKGSWTQISQGSLQRENTVGEQLSLSVKLGQKAVELAKNGDLEQARFMAELSAQAMTGGLGKGDLAKNNIEMIVSQNSVAAPANVKLQKEMLKKTYQQIERLGNGADSQAVANLDNLSSIYQQVIDKPLAATTYLAQLDKGSSAAANNQTSQAGVVDVRGEESFCTQKQQGTPEITPERRLYLLKRLQATKQNLANIDAALKKISELNAQDLKALQQLGAEINVAYDDSVARLAEVAVDLLHDSLLWKDKKAFDKTTAYYEESLAEIDKSLSYRLGMKTTALEPKELQKVEERIKVLQSSKVRLQEWYERIKLLYQEQQLKKGKVIVYTKDVAVVAKQENFMEKAKEGFLATVGIALDYPGLEEAWKSVKIFSKARFDIVSGTWTYGQYIVDYSIDILAQRYAWEPLLKQLNNNIEANRTAVLNLQQKFKEQQKELECLESVLR